MADTLQRRLALIAAAQPPCRVLARSYAETILRAECERALLSADAATLRALDRVREAMGCAPDSRVSEFLQEKSEQTGARHVRP